MTTLSMFLVAATLLGALLVWRRWLATAPAVLTRAQPSAGWLDDLEDAEALARHQRCSIIARHYDLQFLIPAVSCQLRGRSSSLEWVSTASALRLRFGDGSTVTLSDMVPASAVRAHGLAAWPQARATLSSVRLGPDVVVVGIDVAHRRYKIVARSIDIDLT